MHKFGFCCWQVFEFWARHIYFRRRRRRDRRRRRHHHHHHHHNYSVGHLVPYSVFTYRLCAERKLTLFHLAYQVFSSQV